MSNSASAVAIEPFWLRIGKIWMYPLQMGPMAAIVGLSLLQAVASYLPGIIGLIINVLCMAAVYRYAFEILRATANGHMEPPEGLSNLQDDLGRSQIALVSVFWLLAVFGGRLLLANDQMLLAVLWVAVLGLAYPGATMSLAIDMSFWHAINPATWFAIIARLGWPYFVVALLCLLFSYCQANAAGMLRSTLPGPIAVLLTYAIGNYVTIASFHLMGYLIYQYHDELGYEIDAPVLLRKPSGKDDPDQGLLDECEGLARDGKLDQAGQLLAGHLRTRGGSIAMHQRYRKILAARQDTVGSLSHGREWLSILLAQEKTRDALNLARECVAIDRQFKPQRAEEVHVLAEAAQQQGQAQLALQLVSGFHLNHPKHKDIPKNLLLAAKLLAENFNQEAKARSLLEELKKRYASHELIGEVDHYLQFLDKLAVPMRIA